MTIRGPFAIALAALLFVSLALNFMIAGFTLARIAGPRPPSDIDRILAIGARDYPPEIRDAIAERMRVGRGQFRDRMAAIEAARQRMLVTMRAQPFDRAAFGEAANALRGEIDSLMQASQDVVGEAVASASPEARRSIGPPAHFPGP